MWSFFLSSISSSVSCSSQSLTTCLSRFSMVRIRAPLLYFEYFDSSSPELSLELLLELSEEPLLSDSWTFFSRSLIFFWSFWWLSSSFLILFCDVGRRTIGDKCDPYDDANVLGSLLSPIVLLPTSPQSQPFYV